MVQAGRGAVKVPRFDRDVQLLDLLPSAAGRGHAADPVDVPEVVEGRRVEGRKRQLAELRDGRALNGNAQADEGIVDNVPPVSFPGVLAGTPNGQVPHIGHVADGIDEAGHIGGCVEQGGVLLRQDLAQLRVGVLGPREGRAHARVRLVEKGNLVARQRMDQRRQKRRLGVGKVKGQVLDVMSDPAQGRHARRPGEGAGREADVDAGEEPLGHQVAAGR